MTYQIRDWDSTYENDRSRTRKKCSFVCVPNKQHGMGFSRLMAEPDGAAIYGIFHCLVGACSQQERRCGWLTDDGEQAGSAWGVQDMAIKFRRPEPEIARALQVLSSPKVGWLAIHNTQETRELQPAHRAVTADSPPTHLEEKRIEEKRIAVPRVASLPKASDPIRMAKPSREQLELQAAKIGLPDGEVDKFLNHYESNGWRVGKNPMRSWVHALANWKSNLQTYAPKSEQPKPKAKFLI